MDGNRGTVNDGGEAVHVPNVAVGGSRETVIDGRETVFDDGGA